jgi:sensor histidine kinase regulating citrate/malate metabolism
VIIGNTFDNAIKECVTIADANSQINVTLIQQNRMLFYEIVNPCVNIPHKKAGKHRGYGLENVRRCVGKYDGSMESGIIEGQYRVSIRLN